MSDILSYIDKVFSGFSSTGLIHLDKDLNLYVSPNGSDDNIGTEDKPLRSVQYATDVIAEHIHLGNHRAYINIDSGDYTPVRLGDYISNTGTINLIGCGSTMDDVVIGQLNTNSGECGLSRYISSKQVNVRNLTMKGRYGASISNSVAIFSNVKFIAYKGNIGLSIIDGSYGWLQENIDVYLDNTPDDWRKGIQVWYNSTLLCYPDVKFSIVSEIAAQVAIETAYNSVFGGSGLVYNGSSNFSARFGSCFNSTMNVVNSTLNLPGSDSTTYNGIVVK